MPYTISYSGVVLLRWYYPNVLLKPDFTSSVVQHVQYTNRIHDTRDRANVPALVAQNESNTLAIL